MSDKIVEKEVVTKDRLTDFNFNKLSSALEKNNMLSAVVTVVIVIKKDNKQRFVQLTYVKPDDLMSKKITISCDDEETVEKFSEILKGL